MGERRPKLFSTYVRWALAIDGLEVAADKYADPAWGKTHKFVVSSLGPDRPAGPELLQAGAKVP